MSETQVDVTKVKGAALKTPTVTAALPISVENPALAYDSAKDRFKIDIEAIAGEDQSARDWSLDLAKLQNLPTDPAKESGKLTTIDSTLTAIDSVLDDVKALLAGGLPAALDGEALKVSEQNWPASYVVEATDLDIRDLTETERTPLGSKGVALQQKTTSNDLIVTLDGETITVQATDLDIRDLTTTERTPLGSNAAPLQQVAGDNALRVREQEFPSDYPDAATLAILVSLLAGGLPSTLTADKLKVRATEIETLLAAGLPSALDGDALKVSEQSPLSTIEVSNFPADYPDSAVATLLAAGLPTALDTDALKTREQNPITGFATQTTLALIAGYVDGLEALLGGGLPAALTVAGNLKVSVEEGGGGGGEVEVTNWPADYPNSAVATLLAAGLPSALDGDALKVKEQSPLTEIEVSNFPADYPDSAVATLLAAGLPAALGGAGGLKVEELNPIASLGVDNFPADYPDSAVATLLAAGLPAALGGEGGLKTEEQSWPTVLQTATAIGTLADVTAAASATRLTANSTPCKTVTVKALAGNTNKVRVGDSNVTASRGHELSKDQAVDIVVNNVNLIYVFGNASDKVSVIYVN
jgi:hypothetical protein